MTHRRHRLTKVVFLIVAIKLSACGSTVPENLNGQSGSFDSTGESVASAGEFGAVPEGGDVTLPAGSGIDTSTGSGPGAQLGGTAAGPGSSSPGGSGEGANPGASVEPSDPVKIGVWTVNGPELSAALAAFGYSAQNVDNRAMEKALFDDWNAKGGILGHPVERVVYESTSSKSVDQNSQDACAKYTQDNKIIGFIGMLQCCDENLSRCLERNAVAESHGNAGAYFDWDPARLRSRPLVLNPDGLFWDRLAPVLADQLQQMKYFTGWDNVRGQPGAAPVKFGVIVPDTAGWRSIVSNYLTPALAKHGQKIALTAYSADSTSDLSSIVLQFKSQNITHVYTPLLLLFGSAAESQQFRPRYVMMTSAWPIAVKGSNPPAQLNGSVGIGWQPSYDTPSAYWPTLTSKGQECLDVMKRANVDVSSESAQYIALIYCEGAWAMKAAYEAGGGISPAEFIAGVDKMGSSYTPVSTFKTVLGPDRHDGAAVVRRLEYTTECNCYRYTGGDISIG